MARILIWAQWRPLKRKDTWRQINRKLDYNVSTLWIPLFYPPPIGLISARSYLNYRDLAGSRLYHHNKRAHNLCNSTWCIYYHPQRYPSRRFHWIPWFRISWTSKRNETGDSKMVRTSNRLDSTSHCTKERMKLRRQILFCLTSIHSSMLFICSMMANWLLKASNMDTKSYANSWNWIKIMIQAWYLLLLHNGCSWHQFISHITWKRNETYLAKIWKEVYLSTMTVSPTQALSISRKLSRFGQKRQVSVSNSILFWTHSLSRARHFQQVMNRSKSDYS